MASLSLGVLDARQRFLDFIRDASSPVSSPTPEQRLSIVLKNSDLSQIRKLDLSNTALDPSCAQQIAELIQSTSETLESLILDNNGFDSKSLSLFSSVLKGEQQQQQQQDHEEANDFEDSPIALKKLSIRSNAILDVSSLTETLSLFQKQNFEQQQQEEEEQEQEDDEEWWRRQSSATSTTNFMKSPRTRLMNLCFLDLSRNYLGRESFKSLATMIEKNGTLRTLRLSGCACPSRIFHPESSRWVQALSQNSTLKILDLSFCQIDSENAKWIFSALKQNSSLRELNLQENNFGDEGLIELAQLLKTNSILSSINIFQDGVSAGVISSFGDDVPGFSEDATDILAQVFRTGQNQSIEKFVNSICDSNGQSIDFLVSKNRASKNRLRKRFIDFMTLLWKNECSD